jgi:aminopeptidase N
VRQATSSLTLYVDPAWAPTGWAELARTANAALLAAEPGSGFQLAWARAYASAARSDEDLATLRGWLDGVEVPAGLTIDTELRWSLLHSLVANGAAGTGQIEAELARDRTASGEREAAYAHALVPTAANKAAVWAELTGPEALPNWRNRALLQGFAHPAQVELLTPYREKYFAAVDQVWAQRDSEPAQEFAQLAYPTYLVDDDTVAATDAWLAGDGHPASLRRLVAEGRDGVVRALRARAKDAQSA